jgi:hypothetical protein
VLARFHANSTFPKIVLPKIAPVRPASRRKAPFRSAPYRLAPRRSAWIRVAPRRWASFRSASLRVAPRRYFGVMLAVLANRSVYSALTKLPVLCDKEERLRRDPRLAKGDQAASAKHKTCHLSAPSLGSGARAHRGVRARSGGVRRRSRPPVTSARQPNNLRVSSLMSTIMCTRSAIPREPLACKPTAHSATCGRSTAYYDHKTALRRVELAEGRRRVELLRPHAATGSESVTEC